MGNRAHEMHVPDRDTDLAYLAGLIDGEGCITRKRQKGNWIVSIAMTDKEVIDWCEAIGGGVYLRVRKPPRKNMYHWHVCRREHVRALLLAVLPYMKLEAKRDKALKAIAEIESRLETRGISHYVAALKAPDPVAMIEESEDEDMSRRRTEERARELVQAGAEEEHGEPERAKMRPCEACGGTGEVPVD